MESQTVQAEPQLVPEQIEREIIALDWRDLQLWLIGLLVLTAFAAGFLALVMPQVVWPPTSRLAHQGNILQLFFGLIALLALLNAYLLQQHFVLQKTRHQLIHQLQVAERAARTDTLTGVYNRRLMEEALAREMARAERNHTKLSVMLADIDDFKEFNTRFGHLTGDRVLIEVAALLRKNFRAADFVTRYGGDEFLIIMPDTDVVQAGVAIKRLLQLLERWNGKENRGYTVSICCGAAAYTPGLSLAQLLQGADADLYVQKAERNSLDHQPGPT